MNILLIGFMGAGKTTVGQELALDLSKHFIDLDQAIVEHVGQGIPAFFSQVGEPTFREIEAKMLAKVLEQPDTVISTGGGVIETQSCMDLMSRPDVFTIWLNSDFSTVTERLLIADDMRPLMQQHSLASFFKLWQNRQVKYAQMADLMITTDRKTPNEIVDEITRHMDEPTVLDMIRSQIDSVDRQILQAMVTRMALVDEVAGIKANHKLAVVQPGRMLAMRERLQKRFKNILPDQVVADYLNLMTTTAIQREEAQI
ncbi:shikimate kinase [Weissella confusa]|uniref:shikimate kinase n=1 Tax=Weissella confusa TaxID=1583 RepID=UPI003526889D